MVEHGFFLMKYLVVRCETFCGLKKLTFLIKQIIKNYCFWNIYFQTFIKIYSFTIWMEYFWQKRSMFESKNECLIKNLKGFDFEILFLNFKIKFWLEKSFFDKNSFDHNSYDFLSIWDVIGTDRRGILLRFFLAYFLSKKYSKKWFFS